MTNSPSRTFWLTHWLCLLTYREAHYFSFGVYCAGYSLNFSFVGKRHGAPKKPANLQYTDDLTDYPHE